MNGNKLFLDTNIILYLLQGDETVSELLNKKQFYISFITQLELLSFPGLNKKDISIFERLLSECVIIDINSEIKTTTINLRRKFKLKLPDCIIAATSLYLDLPLITANDDFKKIDHLNLLFYKK